MAKEVEHAGHMYLAVTSPEAGMDFGEVGKVKAVGGVAYFDDAQHAEFQRLLKSGRIDLNQHFQYVDQEARKAEVKLAMEQMREAPKPAAVSGTFTTALADMNAEANNVRNPTPATAPIVIPGDKEPETAATVVDLTTQKAPAGGIFGAKPK